MSLQMMAAIASGGCRRYEDNWLLWQFTVAIKSDPGGSGAKTKCNCQDYADALRAKYREIKDDPEVKCKCKKGK